jgi:hypothetical protein
MTLPTGTALHHGHYVIDAFSAEDTLGPIYLATHIPSGRWVQLRILGSRHPETIPYPEQRQSFYRYLLAVKALQHPLFSGGLSGFEEDGVCYQVIDANLGHPLTHLVAPGHPASPRQSFVLARQVGQGLLALKALGWQGVNLSPDQFWQAAPTSPLTFIGFDFPDANAEPCVDQEALLVRGLSHFLYFLLTGHRAETTRAPLAVDVRNRLPGLPYDLDTLLQLGSRQDIHHPSILLQDWLKLLPENNGPGVQSISATTPESPSRASAGEIPQNVRQSAPPVATQASTSALTPRPVVSSTESSSIAQMSSYPARKWAFAALGFTALIASIGGLGLGLTVRLQPGPSRSTTLLNPEQSFPPLADWSGDDPVADWDDMSPSRRFLPDYGDRPTRPVLPQPPVTSESTVEETNVVSGPTDEAAPSALDSSSAAEAEAEDSFFDSPEPFTSEPENSPTPGVPQSPGRVEKAEETGSDATISEELSRETPNPIRPVPDSAPSLQAPPAPLTAPAPLPSAPSPSNGQTQGETGTTI